MRSNDRCVREQTGFLLGVQAVTKVGTSQATVETPAGDALMLMDGIRSDGADERSLQSESDRSSIPVMRMLLVTPSGWMGPVVDVVEDEEEALWEPKMAGIAIARAK